MVDLHMHSNYSDDGEFTPLELVEKCAAWGVELMAVTELRLRKSGSKRSGKGTGNPLYFRN